LGCRFLDADDFHPPANVAKMAAGTPLTDADRWPWLDRLRDEMASAHARGESVVLACSALREAYRDRLAQAGDVRFVFLDGPVELIAERAKARSHRYMPPALLPSQIATLEPPADALRVGIDMSPNEQVDFIVERLGAKQ
jgi:gluconokinase